MRFRSKLTLATLLIGSRAADIDTQFWVEKGAGAVTRSGQSGNLGGSCYPYTDVLNDLYLEAMDMTEVALEALGNYASNPTVRATLETYMGIKPDGTGVSAAHTSQSITSKVQAYQKVVNFGTSEYDSERLPAFFCDDGWRWNTTMECVDGKQTGRTIHKASGGRSSWMFYAPRLKMWAGMHEGCKNPDTLAYTLVLPWSITICPGAWTWWRRKDSLKPWRDGTRTMTQGKPFHNAYSLPGTVLHELIHLTSKQNIMDKKVIVDNKERPAYFPIAVAELAKTSVEDAVRNADSYAWFAAAMYLPAFDWSRKIAGVYAGSPISTRSIGNASLYLAEGNGLKRRTYFMIPTFPDFEDEEDAMIDYSR
ncbi:hypothetical protein BO78DRAFT_424757 [Aspergillus sclerotiicarbonarius CBS 121057]|uniref:Uncharacterized protein n=1 Tax=Aspergillus sclerotiicarbonarius (strain CBS 121057 / IBT 28362) TaxID=1448318 RepID=A0A319EW95_ASPSB|nr:hypothetical protein BO78DRAFT_424757 [Aspergillus sclerotiicarbonarius CBS 121057]